MGIDLKRIIKKICQKEDVYGKDDIIALIALKSVKIKGDGKMSGKTRGQRLLLKANKKLEKFIEAESKHNEIRPDVVRQFADKQIMLINGHIKECLEQSLGFQVVCDLKEVTRVKREEVYGHYVKLLELAIYIRRMNEMDEINEIFETFAHSDDFEQMVKDAKQNGTPLSVYSQLYKPEIAAQKINDRLGIANK